MNNSNEINSTSNNDLLTVDAVDICYIDNGEQFETIAKQWQNIDCLAIDTEFERRTTYYAKLALVQVFDGKNIYLIDPIKTDCANSFRRVLGNKNITKILHSSKEDLEVLYTAWNCKINNLFDTQVAVNFIQGDASLGYAKLVGQFTGELLDKESTNSDWLKRPLSEKQLSYAANDVLYLIEIYKKLENQLSQKHNSNYFTAECQEYTENAILRVEVPASYREVIDAWKLSETELSLFKLLFDWREEKARNDNRTKNHIIKDVELVQLVQKKCTNISQLKSLESLHPRSIRLYGEQWIQLIKQWQSSEQLALPLIVNSRDLTKLKGLTKAIEKIVNIKAIECEITPTLLLSKRLIRKLAYSLLTANPMPMQWSGWRKKLLLDDINDLVADHV